MNWNEVLTGDRFESWIAAKLASDRVSQGVRLDPFATSMRDFGSAASNLKLLSQGNALPQRGGAGNQVRTDLSAAMLVSGGTDGTGLTPLGNSVLKEWERIGVADSAPEHELARCVALLRCALAERSEPYVAMTTFWKELRGVASFEDIVQHPDFLYLVSFLNTTIDGFNPWHVLKAAKLSLAAAAAKDFDAIKRRYPNQGTLIDKLAGRVHDWATRPRGRKLFCTAIELLQRIESERTSLLQTMHLAPEQYVGDFDSESVNRALNSESRRGLENIVADFSADLKRNGVGLVFSKLTLTRFFCSLLAKRFLILTGLSGSGKTKLAQAVAHWLSPIQQADESGTSQSNRGGSKFRLVSVGADWTGSEHLLGYPDGLNRLSFILRPTLEIALQAAASPGVAHFLILDEMNLSHVERYFADFLSGLESGEQIHLHSDPGRQSDGLSIPQSFSIPPNLFIIGTVNVDETTYMFSPKVLDRANVLEFRMLPEDLKNFLDNAAKPDLAGLAGLGHDAGYGGAFTMRANDTAVVPTDVKESFDGELLLFFQILQSHGAEFGYRTAFEAGRFVHYYKLLGEQAEDDNAWFKGAFDCVIVQKLLPKLHGSRAKLGPVLKKLWFLCVTDTTARGDDPLKAADDATRSTDKKFEPAFAVPADAPYPMSAEKIARMWRLLMDNGFASFAEA